MYGQSFQYIEIEYDENILYDIIKQIHIMESNIYIDNSKYKNMIFKVGNEISFLKKYRAKKFSIHLRVSF